MNGDAFQQALERLAASRQPLIIGVRHHSPACAAAITGLLDALVPDRVMVELPADLQSWLPWLGHAELEPPVALAATRTDSDELFFYPFASFSPELVAIRWASKHGVPVEAFDLPFGARGERTCALPPTDETALSAVLRAHGCPDTESLWERLVEARGLTGAPEAVRRAALAFGLLVRGEGEVGPADAAREAFMRERLAACPPGSRVAAVVGAFHGAGLLEGASVASGASVPVRTSLIPYAFELLDSRSGYPAGIRDPMWQERALAAVRRADSASLAPGVIVEVARHLRQGGLAAGVPDASEAVRFALDLAALRGLVVPGRREVLEAIMSSMGHGEPLGRGRALARALDAVLVGDRRGRLAPGTPRSGLAPAVEALLAELRLPGPGPVADRATEVVLDPLRSELDRRRHVALERLSACGIPYAKRVDRSLFVDAETLTVRWSVHFTSATAAMLELSAATGATLEQAAAGVLRERERKLEAADELTAAARLAGAEQAAECALPELAFARLAAVVETFGREAALAELIAAVLLLERLACGHIPGMIGAPVPARLEPSPLLAAAVRALEGVAGSTQAGDAEALFDLVRLLERHPEVGDGRLLSALRGLAADGSPLMQGAASGVLALITPTGVDLLVARVGSWIDIATSRELRAALAARLRGLFTGGAALFEAVEPLIGAVHTRLVALDDEGFLERLPALREGFAGLSPAARQRLLVAVGDLLADGPFQDALDHAPELLATWARADRAGVAALQRAGLALITGSSSLRNESSRIVDSAPTPGALAPRDRWRLILGQEPERMGQTAARLDVALEELYGRGRGEGSARVSGPRGGQERTFATTRDWAGELEALFGADVCEEVLGRSAERGSPAALLELDPGTVQPSVELLHQVLALKGALGEAQLARLRPLIARIVAQLVRELANRVQPAFAGLVSALPTARPGGPLDLRRTVARNLRTARLTPDGHRLAVERPVFRRRTRKSMDWHIQLVVDVSGSMEPSVIYSAMMAAILSALPALTVSFYAFNTEVIDLTDHVDDPLGLLLEVRVGGGTSIAKAVRYARDTLVVPSRTIVLLVTDFEEGLSPGSLIAEVRALLETGARALGLAALDDGGRPRYNRALAELLVDAGLPVAALTPMELARWVAEQIR